MKTLKITTFWTTEEAGNVYRLLDELQSAVWESYGEDIGVLGIFRPKKTKPSASRSTHDS